MSREQHGHVPARYRREQVTKAASPTTRSPAQILHCAGFTCRVRAWPGDGQVAHLVTVDNGSDVPIAVLRQWLNQVRAMGYAAVRSGALGESACRTYEAIGFVPVQSLALLKAPLADRRRHGAPGSMPVRLRRAHAGEMPRLAALDHRAFPSGWGLDDAAISEARAATPAHRLRVAVTPAADTPIGYAVAGRAGKSSFLQRLAVDPSARRLGVGTALVVDGLCWARRWRATTMTVNTQVDNEPALKLYAGFGFVILPEQLTVVHRILDSDV
jgi:[ribosomal protein S18]-alanine N-acetyltransferase